MTRLHPAPLALAVSLSAGPLAAQVTGFHIDSRTNDDGSLVANVISIDIFPLSFYTGSQLLLELDRGTINQVELPSGIGAVDVAPFPFLWEAFPELAFDTFVAQGAIPSNSSTPGLGGGAVNLGRRAEQLAVWNHPTKISQSSNPVATPDIYGRDLFVVAQLTFTADAFGTFAFFAAPVADDVDHEFYTRAGNVWTGADLYEIRNGYIVPVPEPAAALGLALVGLAWRGRAR